jgi:LysM repeat protein
MSKLGKVKLYIDDEQLNNSVTATAYPVDQGEPITDHIQQQPQTLSLTGSIVKESGYKADLRYFRNCMRKGTLLHYTGRTVAKNVIITTINDQRTNALMNGAGVTAELQFIRIVKEKWTATKAKAKTAKKTVGKKKKTSNKKTSVQYKTIKKGWTYYWISRKYGAPVSQLRSWNKYPDKSLPIGKKIRVA